ncbi:MAG: hypothetical protein VW907_05025, partial [Opitutae bacterium]
ASIAEETLAAYQAFTEAELAVEAAVAAISSADSSQELAFDYVSGVLSKKKEALTDGASDGNMGSVAVAADGSITYTADVSKFVGSFFSLSASNALVANDTFSVIVSIEGNDTTATFAASAGDTLATAQSKLATEIKASSALNNSIEAIAICRIALTGAFVQGDAFSITIGGVTVSFEAEEDDGAEYSVSDIRAQ